MDKFELISVDPGKHAKSRRVFASANGERLQITIYQEDDGIKITTSRKHTVFNTWWEDCPLPCYLLEHLIEMLKNNNITPPYSKEIINQIKEAQKCGMVHELTCPNGHIYDVDENGLWCHCGATQKWVPSSFLIIYYYASKVEYKSNS